LLKEIALLPRSAWRTIELDVPTRKYRTPRVYEQTIPLAGRALRQMFVQDLGHDEPTILLTNQRHTPAPALLTRYAQRMLIENALSDAVRFFHIDALSSAVGLKVDFDMALLVLASGLYRLVARRMRGYGDAQARQIFRRSHRYVGGRRGERQRSDRPFPSPCPPAHPSRLRPHGKHRSSPLVEWIAFAADHLSWPG
jgi:hypothetical protein